jgi:hypothetical protein
MDPTLAHLLEVVLLDAVKILGPAAIAAVVAYRTARAQILGKFDELNQSQSFQAHQAMFAHIKERLKEVDSSLERVNHELGQLMGYVTGMHEDATGDVTDPLLVFLGKVSASMSVPARLEVKATLRDLERLGHKGTELFGALERFANFDLRESPETLNTVRDTFLQLHELHNILAAGLRAVLTSEMQAALRPFVKPENPAK